MKKAFFAPLFFLVLFGNCFADGCIMPMPDYSENIFMPEQKAVIIWDGQTEQLTIESKVTTEDIANFAWLIPIESSTKPEVEEADEQIFFELVNLFEEKHDGKNMDLFGTNQLPESTGVEVIEQLSIDIYDIAILRATDEIALINWLNSNGYSFPEAFPNLLSDYIKSGSYYFVANKINL